ncbi:hypothetical protein UlMin_025296 [Ulmus minor]
MADDPNGCVYVEDVEENGPRAKGSRQKETLYGVLHHLIAEILSPHSGSGGASTPLLHRIKASVAENAPLLPEASINSATNICLWTRRGSPLRALLVISVGSIALLALTGLLIFMLFFLVTTFNAVVISLIMSLAVAGGFLALFFVCVAAIYIGALSVAAAVISTTAFFSVVAIVIATGWIGFFFTVWLATKKSFGLAKHSLSVTSSALSSYSASRDASRRHHQVKDTVSD